MSKSVLAVLCLFALVGCAGGDSDLRSAVEDAGYSITAVFVGSDSSGTRYLELDVAVPDTSAFPEDAKRVAEIVWTTYDGDFDVLEITFNRSLAMSYPHELLTDMFGERPPAGQSQPANASPLPMVIGVVVGALLITAWALFLWRRGRKPRPSAPSAPLTSDELFPTGPEPGEPFSPGGDVIGR